MRWRISPSHGANCVDGSGFHLYIWEINEFFNEFENEIEDFYYNIFGDNWLIDSGAANCDGFDAIRAHLVWGLVEIWCSDKVDETNLVEV